MKERIEGNFEQLDSFEGIETYEDFYEKILDLIERKRIIVGSQGDYEARQVLRLFEDANDKFTNYCNAMRRSNLEEIDEAREAYESALMRITNGKDQGIRTAAEKAIEDSAKKVGYLNEEGAVIDMKGEGIDQETIRNRLKG